MTLLKKIFGICETKKPQDPGAWRYHKGKLVIEWARVPELQKPCGAIRIEGQDLPQRIFVLYGMDGQFHAFRNRCTLMRRRLDPVSGSAAIHCGGLRGLTFDYSGHVISGSAKKPLKKYRAEMNKCKLIVWLD